MSANSSIEWTDHTFNPWWGCSRVSAGCVHCYAETLGHRFGVEWGPLAYRRPASEDQWAEPMRWNASAKRAGRRSRVFCASMADVFDDVAPEHALSRLFDLIRVTPWLDWQLLTKRPENIRAALPADWGHGYRNVWLGVSVEDQRAADERIPLLLQVPAAVRFLSCEPLLGQVNLQKAVTLACPNKKIGGCERHEQTGHRVVQDSEAGGIWVECACSRLGGIDWVIAGGESGPGARPMHPDWARHLRDQCHAAGVPFFFKQWGGWIPVYDRDQEDPDWRRCDLVKLTTPKGQWLNLAGGQGFHGDRVVRVNRQGKTAAGRLLDGREWNEFPKSKEVENGQG